MEQLRYADEVKPFEEVPIGDGKVKKEEMKLAVQLIEQGATDEYHPEQFKDEVYNRVLEQIERKIQGEEITAAPPPETEGKIIDLMDALKASLAEAEEGKGARKPAKKTSRKKAAGSRKASQG
jgi:DNA end-binding protein Ku